MKNWSICKIETKRQIRHKKVIDRNYTHSHTQKNNISEAQDDFLIL